VLDHLAADDAVFTCDVGAPTIWAARYLTMNGKRRIIASFNYGSMANALPQAIGAQVSHPGRQAISMSFLAEETVGFITGQTLFVDGGARFVPPNVPHGTRTSHVLPRPAELMTNRDICPRRTSHSGARWAEIRTGGGPSHRRKYPRR
jgi:hypothetical protein